jgi:hypothetical protein
MMISSFDVADAASGNGDCRLLGTATSGVSRRETNASRRLQRYLCGAVSLARRRVIHVERVAALRDLISAV